MGINMREIYYSRCISAFVKPAPKNLFETFNYLKYRNKLDLTQIDQIYYAPASAFLKLNLVYEQNCSYIGTFKSKRYQGAPKNISTGHIYLGVI
jgi:hypothetical protein